MNKDDCQSNFNIFQWISIFFTIAIVLGFIGGVIHIFLVRFKIGDIYPVYSTLRSDPLGTKVFYESLSRLESVEVSRNFDPIEKIFISKPTTLFFLGSKLSSYEFLSEKSLKGFDGFVLTGGRLVISFFPIQELPLSENQKKFSRTFYSDALTAHWHVNFASEKTNTDNSYPMVVQRNSNCADLPETMLWQSSLFFTDLHPSWKIIYTNNNHPVVIERAFGKGTIVLISDSYVFSNEALLKNRQPKFLFWCVQHPRVIFDESHFGIRYQHGMMYLIRKFNLHGFLIAIMIVSALYIWKNANSLIEMKPDNLLHKEIKIGKDHTEGFICLLRRNIDQKKLLKICFDEWHKTIQNKKNYVPESTVSVIRSTVNLEGESDLVKQYQKIYYILHKKQ